MLRENFSVAVLDIAASKPIYQKGHDGSDGKCDCVGLIIGAIRRCGEKYKETHGSNWFARNVTNNLRVATQGTIKNGGLVYKAREPGDIGYSLPSRYDKDKDKKDYYHIGYVWSVDPLIIIHCTTTYDGKFIPGNFPSCSIQSDTKLGKWSYTGELPYITDYEENNGGGGNLMETKKATVVANTGSTVNMRKEANKSAALVEKVPVGTIVDIIEDAGEWCKIRYLGKTGYMMSNYIEYDGMADDTDSDELVKVRKEDITEIINILSKMLAGGQ